MRRIERMLEPLQTASAELSLQELSLQLNRESDAQDVQRVPGVRHVEYLAAHPKKSVSVCVGS